MRYRSFFRPAAALVAAVLAAVLAFAQDKVAATKKAPPAPLVRLDLLAAQEAAANPAAPLRDLFSPGRASPASEPVEMPGDTEASADDEAGLEGTEGTAPEPPALDATYIGYIRSGRGIIALIVTGGQAVAVAEGEEIVPGQKVERIAPDRVEVVGPDGKRTSVPIQGEQP
jgi:hypothetical protein